VLARQTGARVVVVDVGVAAKLDAAPGLARRKVRAGTGNLAREPAMSIAEAQDALDVGAAVAARLVVDGALCLVTGDMGIGNTTPSAALVAAFTRRAAADVTGRGTGIDDTMLAQKVETVERGLARTPRRDDPIAVLASLGGLEIAALTGFVVGGAAARVPIVVDGVIAGAALLTATRIVPGVVSFCFAGHRSTEPAARIVLDTLGLDPILDLELRLGEGSGACLALPVLAASARILGEMATFDAAGVTDKPD
jgi:nicotinate-nucleotide--dimethylbenzimidazole phosphoribosyltransferase